MTEDVHSADSSEKSGALNEVVEIVKTVVYALLIALFLRVLFFQPFTIPSASMDPTLLEGDYIIVSKYSYGYSKNSIPFSPPLFKGRIMDRMPERGDIIVFKLPRDGHIDYIKRLVGLPGDRIQMQGGVLFINGKAVPRRALPPVMVDSGYGFTRNVERYEETLPNGKSYITYDFGPDGDVDNTGVFVVPEGSYFFMGDNRDNSLDSRVPAEIGVGYVPAENLVGKARIIMLSWNKGASLFKPWTWVLDARPSRFFHTLK
ncbi:MAG: signal peptidase I [Phenylobacterium sp.]|jgi:signal peptidase I|uniref:Signal peptidase I n=1 Tax=Phenylobacterium ferrooxidans TaxID=2982689 RepID=A0ABW6CHD9_9CAUL|nr:signal peptidase I [Phenylobacterium sp.]MDO8322626.1 signal peptidase I [Phenylobacterium sp.]MDO8910293.1 signal peptidase I [Phenylobacterium sp.]MDP2008597.1 signal peptidase I [Phenylobacterium sp.]MDP3102824.1 signal peptidase I [Phenylobacterium sp.]MDP3635094.1 signal peptidase I [Phenylobacterium sp.]